MSKLQLFKKVEECKAIENERDKLIAAICDENDRLLAEVEQLKVEAERAKYEARDHFERFKKCEDAVNKLQQKHDDGGFVSVLVDGDCVPFVDNLVKRGVSGGTEAAGLLVSAVKQLVDERVDGATSRITVAVRIYANVKGLGKAYHASGVLKTPSDLLNFIRGFNMGHPMVDFIDAGDGKECSDDKLKENFKLSMSDVHCKHVLFACSADNGYARLLAPLKADQAAIQRVTLVEGPPFASELCSLAAAFRTHSFPGVFRMSKLTAHALGSPATGALGYATVVASATPQQNNNDSNTSTTHAQSIIGQPVAQNASGQRIDRPLAYSQSLAKIFRKRKLCNLFHLVGVCPYDPCTHKHGARLSDEELRALAHVARMTPCRNGLSCDDVWCILGHQCAFGGPCPRQGCRFRMEMHGVDTRIV